MTVNMPMTFNTGKSGRNIETQMRLPTSSLGSSRSEQLQ
jgi:hypothetical protein